MSVNALADSVNALANIYRYIIEVAERIHTDLRCKIT